MAAIERRPTPALEPWNPNTRSGVADEFPKKLVETALANGAPEIPDSGNPKEMPPPAPQPFYPEQSPPPAPAPQERPQEPRETPRVDPPVEIPIQPVGDPAPGNPPH